jgi:hypothetical protein
MVLKESKIFKKKIAKSHAWKGLVTEMKTTSDECRKKIV